MGADNWVNTNDSCKIVKKLIHIEDEATHIASTLKNNIIMDYANTDKKVIELSVHRNIVQTLS